MPSYRDIIEADNIDETNRLSLKRLWREVGDRQDWALVWTASQVVTQADESKQLEAALVSEGFDYFPLKCRYRLNTGKSDFDPDCREDRLLFVVKEHSDDLISVVKGLTGWRLVR